MKAILEFNLDDNDDEESHRLALKAGKLYSALWDIRQNVFRPARKHGYANDGVNILLRTMSESEREKAMALVGELERMFSEILDGHGLSEFEI
jgi:hypothetical protein